MNPEHSLDPSAVGVKLGPLEIDFGSHGQLVKKFTPLPRLASPTMSWGIYDFTAMESESFPANGAHFHSLGGHRYLVVLRAEDPFGIAQVTLDGSGRFEAWTEPNSSGVSYGAPHRLPASIPHREYSNHGDPPSLQDLVVIMEPDIGAWVYEELSCGVHSYGTLGPKKYLAVSGEMKFSGTSRNIVGRESTATLTTTP